MAACLFSPASAQDYLRLFPDQLLAEAPDFSPYAKVSEWEIQARFYAGEFGDSWTTLCGKSVKLVHPGEWNREAGPDFLQAVVAFDQGSPQQGDIEIDLEASGWEAHGHGINPAFSRVILHGFLREGGRRCFARTSDQRAVPQVCLVPVPPGARITPLLMEPVSSPEVAERLIRLAASHRLQSKARVLERSRRFHGSRRAFWQALAAALGYRGNSIPMTLLAQRVSPKRAASAEGEALLFGLAGFLEDRPRGVPEPESGRFWLGLWEHWWKLRLGEERLILPPSAWKHTGGRPANHPHRRVAALAALAPHFERLARALEAGEEKLFAQGLLSLDHPFWRKHWHLDGRALPGAKTIALIGKNRLTDILINVWVPWRALEKEQAWQQAWAQWERLAPGQIPRKVVELARWLYPDYDKEGMKLHSALIQQGLLQLGQDFFGVESPRALEQRWCAL